MKFDLKKFLKTLKLNENSISMVLGAIVIVVTTTLVVNYFKDKGSRGSLDGGQTAETEFAKTHTVVKGENLWAIAEAEIGSGYNWTDIARENNLANPSLIFAGQKLNIPSVEPIVAGKPAAKTVAVENQTTSGSITGATYEVVKGDTLWNIAIRAYGDGYKWSEIARENHLVNPSLIHPGNILALPR